MSNNYNFEINFGESLVIDLTWTDDDDAPIDFTTGEAVFICEALEIEYDLALYSDGRIEGVILDTTDFEAGTSEYYIKPIDTDLNVSRLLQGKICIHNVPVW